jgi:glycosyltransferase involved in cell wall biosynthesis
LQHAVHDANQPLRILHIDYGVGFGGSIVSLSELVRGLEILGCAQSEVLTCQAALSVRHLFPKTRVTELHPRLTYLHRARLEHAIAQDEAWIKVIGWSLRKGYAAMDALHDRWFAARIARIGERFGAEIIHANNGLDHSAILAARALQVPCIAHVRGFPSASDTMWSSRRELFDSGAVSCVCISHAVAEAMKRVGVPSHAIHTIHNPVSAEPYLEATRSREAVRSRHSIQPTDLVVGVFGRVTAWKGQLEFLRAVEPLLAEWSRLRIMIVGDESDAGTAAYGTQVREYCERPELKRQVVFTGYRREVAEYYAACDIVVHCSREPEPFGRVVIEGMAAGKPVIAMNEGGPPEIITHGVDGLLVPPRDDEALRRALADLVRHPAQISALGTAAAHTIRSRFSPEASARAFMAASRRPRQAD